MKKKIKVALPKGRFYDRSLAIINNNIDQNIIESENGKKLVFESDDFIFFLLKSPDICSLIFNGNVDIGIVPDEWILEYELENKMNFKRLIRVDWVNTKISLISDSTKKKSAKCKIASSYPNITRKYLLEKGIDCNSDYKICKLNGSIEATIPRIFSFGIECVESGETLSCNDLKELDIIHNNLALSLILNKDCRINTNLINKLIM